MHDLPKSPLQDAQFTEDVTDAIDYLKDALENHKDWTLEGVDASLPLVIEAAETLLKVARVNMRVAEMYRKQMIYWFTAYTDQAAKRVEDQEL